MPDGFKMLDISSDVLSVGIEAIQVTCPIFHEIALFRSSLLIESYVLALAQDVALQTIYLLLKPFLDMSVG
jgi:hypothetical protein